jgi:hypothetical protein
MPADILMTIEEGRLLFDSKFRYTYTQTKHRIIGKRNTAGRLSEKIFELNGSGTASEGPVSG